MNTLAKRISLTSFSTLTSLAIISFSTLTDATGNPEDLFKMSFEDLLQVKVTIAARKKESWLEASGTVLVISREDINAYGWRDLKEILMTIPNMDVFYQWSWLPGGQRGFTGNMSSTLLMIDGREVQNVLANEAFIMNNFPAHRIERVEVLQGPNSTLYGGNAAQGVINIVTRLESKEPISEVSVLFGEVNTRQINALFNGQINQWHYGLSISKFSSDLDYSELRDFVFDDQRYSRNAALDQLRDHNSDNFRNNEENTTVDGRLAYHSTYAGFNLTRTYNISGIERVAVDYVNGDDSDRGYTQMYAGQEFSPNDKWQGFVEISRFSEYKEKQRQKVANLSTALSYDDLIIFTEREDIGPSKRYRLRSQWKYDVGDQSDWILGYDGWRTDIGSKVSYVATDNGIELRTPSSWPMDKEKADKHAIYSQYAKRWKLNDVDSLALTLGLRFNSQDFTDNAWLPRLSLVYQQGASSALKYTYGEAFRPPTIFEFDGVEDDTLVSQTMLMHELNYSKGWDWGDFHFVNVAAIYQMQVENFYNKVFDTQLNYWRTEVTGQQEVKGLEDQLKWQTNDWQGFVGFRYVKPDKTAVNGNLHILNVPQSKIKIGITREFGDFWRTSLFIDHWASTLTEANTLSGDATELYKIPSWTSVNLYFAAQKIELTSAVTATVGLYIENLFDETYYHANARGTSPYQFIQAPRNFRLQAEINF